MNLICKEDRSVVFLEPKDLDPGSLPAKLRDVPITGTSFTVNISETNDLSIETLSVFLSLASTLRASGVRYEIVTSPSVAQQISLAGCESIFDTMRLAGQ